MSFSLFIICDDARKYKLLFHNCENLYNKCRLLYRHLVVKSLDTYKLIEFIINDNGKTADIVYENQCYLKQNPLFFLHCEIVKNHVFSDDFIMLHGAAVSCCGRTSLLIAPTKRGKSTLTAYLSLMGFDVFTDDSIIINKLENEIIPPQIPLFLRSGGVNIIKSELSKNNGKEFDPVFAGEDRWLFLPNNLSLLPSKIDKIFFIRLCSINYLRKINSTECYTGLLMSLSSPTFITRNNLSYIKKISNLDAYSLDFSDIGFVKETISSN